MSTKITPNYEWTNEHNSIKQLTLKRYEISNEDGVADFKPGLKGIQKMLGEVLTAKERLRSYGGKWSLSDVAISTDAVHNTKPLTFFAPIGKSKIIGQPLFPSAKPLEERLFFIQCGAQIMQLNTTLEQMGLAFPTTGASNGQTLAGAVSTGTHGSAIRVGSMQEFVRGIHIVTSDKEHFFIQPATDTVLSPDFAAKLGATPIVNDDIFNSAVVSFGSFGVIHALVVETVPLYMLESHCERHSYSDVAGLFPLLAAFKPASTTNLTQYLKQFNIKTATDPHHIELVINPHATTDNAYIKAMMKLPYDPAKISPPDMSNRRVGDDILSTIGLLADYAGDTVAFLTKTFFGEAATVRHGYTQTPRYTFGDSTVYHGGTSMELGVPIAQAEAAVVATMKAAKKSKLPGLLGVRFVKPTKATLGFTRFAPLTCTIEIVAANTQATLGGYRTIFNALDAAQIPFTLHWGQQGDYSPWRLRKMYGPALDTWIKARTALLPTSLQRYVFSNEFMKRCGLAEPMPLTAGAPIV